MFACIYVPDFPVEAIVRAESLLRQRAVVVLDGKPPLTRVVALNTKARTLGIEAGMTKLQATIFAESNLAHDDAAPSQNPRNSSRKSHHSGLTVVRQRSSEQENSAHSALLDVAHAFTPRVEDTASDMLLLDLEGLYRLYGSSKKIAHDLAARVAAIGLAPNVGLAENPDAAMHAARGFTGITVIDSGKEAEHLSSLPVKVLLEAMNISLSVQLGKKSSQKKQQLRQQLLETLEHWGIRDFGTLGKLPESALASRLGDVGVQLRNLALGRRRRTLRLCEPSVQFEEYMELERAVEAIESFSFILNRLLEQLCARLAGRALALQGLRLRLQLERHVADEEGKISTEINSSLSSRDGTGKLFERYLRLPVPMRDSKVLLKLLQLDLTANPPGAPVIKIWITAQAALPRLAQRGLFLPITPESEKLEITLARISAIVGEHYAGRAYVLETHHPEGFCLERFTVPIGETPNAKPKMPLDTEGYSTLAIRIFRPPYRLLVRLTDGRPTALAVHSKNHKSELNGEIVWLSGPWLTSGNWWAETSAMGYSSGEHLEPWNHEEWDIALLRENQDATETSNIAFYRIYREVATGNWFAAASYD